MWLWPVREVQYDLNGVSSPRSDVSFKSRKQRDDHIHSVLLLLAEMTQVHDGSLLFTPPYKHVLSTAWSCLVRNTEGVALVTGPVCTQDSIHDRVTDPIMNALPICTADEKLVLRAERRQMVALCEVRATTDRKQWVIAVWPDPWLHTAESKWRKIYVSNGIHQTQRQTKWPSNKVISAITHNRPNKGSQQDSQFLLVRWKINHICITYGMLAQGRHLTTNSWGTAVSPQCKCSVYCSLWRGCKRWGWSSHRFRLTNDPQSATPEKMRWRKQNTARKRLLYDFCQWINCIQGQLCWRIEKEISDILLFTVPILAQDRCSFLFLLCLKEFNIWVLVYHGNTAWDTQ